MAKMSIDQAMNMARDHFRAGRLAEAGAIARAVLQIEPHEWRAIFALALVAFHTQSPDAAETLVQQGLALFPSEPDFHALLAAIRLRQQRPLEAAQAAQQALRFRPDFPEAEAHLGDALYAMGRVVESEQVLRRVVARAPQNAESWNTLGAICQQQARMAEAESAYRSAISANPRYAEAYSNLAVALQAQSRWQEAEGAYRTALANNPQFADAEANMASLLHFLGRVDEAEAACRRALVLRPNYANAYTNLGASLHSQGRVEEAHDAYWLASKNNPPSAVMHSYALFSEQYLPDVTPQRLLEVHCEWDRVRGQPLRATWRPHTNTPDPHRPIRLGFVSPDFSKHPVGMFLVRIFENLDRQNYQVTLYNDRVVKDEVSQRLARAVVGWRDIRGLLDPELAEQIRTDGMDMLFDLAGHGLNNRLSVFAMKPAPLQGTWLGYEGTTGMSAIDYIVADRYQIGPGEECYYREKPLMMPNGYVCYEALSDAPPVNPLPATAKGYVTFGSFNNLAKITPEVIELWTSIMHRLPGSRIVLKYKGLETTATRKRYADLFAARGIDSARLEMQGWTTYQMALAKYHDIDIALDTFPFSGSLTSCDALWMGVPVVTWPGRTFGGRHTLGHLSRIGLTELIARDKPHYAEIVMGLATDLPRLTRLRASLRQQVAESPLYDGPMVAREFMTAVRQAWREWCQTQTQ